MANSTSRAESGAVVEELLAVLLNDVCSRTRWDIATRGKRLSDVGIVDDPGSKASGPHFDVCTLIRRVQASRVLVNYCMRKGHAEVLQLECAEQQASGYCGHYAFHFTLCCLEACAAINIKDAAGYLGETSSAAVFWRRYWLSVECLLAHVQGSSQWWPWTREHVLTGDMERSYLSYLLEADPHARALQQHSNIFVLHYAYGCILNTVAEVCKMQHSINAFKAALSPASQVFILGVTNHWVSLLAYKVSGDTCAKTATDCEAIVADKNSQQVASTARLNGWKLPKEKISMLYLDSNNVPVLTASDAEILQIMAKKEAESVRKKGRGWSEWKRGVIFQAFVDQREVVRMLGRCLCGQSDLRTELLDASWAQVLDSYERHVSVGSQEDPELGPALLVQWLEVQYRPQSLYKHQLALLRHLGTDLLGTSCRQRLQQWVGQCRQQLEGCAIGMDILDAFRTILDQVEQGLRTEL